MNAGLGSATATEVARYMLDSGEAPPAEAVDKCALTLAWALKGRPVRASVTGLPVSV